MEDTEFKPLTINSKTELFYAVLEHLSTADALTMFRIHLDREAQAGRVKSIVLTKLEELELWITKL